MLMDKGASGGVPGTNLEAGKASGDFSQVRGEIADFNVYVKQRKDLEPQMEQPEVPAETMAEEVIPAPQAVPVEPAKEEETPAESKEVETLRKIAIARDAEALPKEYVDAVAQIVEADKRDPHQLVDDMDKARWDLLSKAYDRKMGDGLNGRMAA